MERWEEIEKKAYPILEERIKKNTDEIMNYYLQHEVEIQEEFVKTIFQGLKEGKKRKKEIQYILISMLNSSIVTKSYEYEMAFYDNRFYLDENPICLYFKLKFLFDFFEEDMKGLKKKLGGCVIRLQEYEVNEIGKEYVLNYYALGTVLLKQMAEQSFLVLGEMKEEVVSSLSKDVVILFGRYMEKPMKLWGKE